MLRTRTGESVLCADLATLFVEAERLAGRRLDPLDGELLAALERGVTKTPITLITGFLGSGKTTLLRELLTRSRDGRDRGARQRARRDRARPSPALAHRRAHRRARLGLRLLHHPRRPGRRAARPRGAARARGDPGLRARRDRDDRAWRTPRRSSRPCSPIRWSRPSTASTGSSRRSTRSTASRSCAASRRRRSRPRWPIACCSRRPTSSSAASSPTGRKPPAGQRRFQVPVPARHDSAAGRLPWRLPHARMNGGLRGRLSRSCCRRTSENGDERSGRDGDQSRQEFGLLR